MFDFPEGCKEEMGSGGEALGKISEPHPLLRRETPFLIIEIHLRYPGVDLGGPMGLRPSLLLNKLFDRECKNVQNSNRIASNSLKMLEIVFWRI